jgi:hypothetical protein
MRRKEGKGGEDVREAEGGREKIRQRSRRSRKEEGEERRSRMSRRRMTEKVIRRRNRRQENKWLFDEEKR